MSNLILPPATLTEAVSIPANTDTAVFERLIDESEHDTLIPPALKEDMIVSFLFGLMLIGIYCFVN